jgi:hypothetical protein
MLIEPDQVLDFEAVRGEAGGTERRPNRMDPAAIATAHIGLEAIRRGETAHVAPRRRAATARRSLRVAIAATLRAAAAAIDVTPQEPARGT